jgi:hypothetical protein
VLSLASGRWGELTQAYGTAEDVPRLLEALDGAPDDRVRAELWFALSRMLYRDGRSYSASYAAVPHLVEIGAAGDIGELAAALHLVTLIEADRRAPSSASMPDDLLEHYAAAIESIPALVASVVGEPWPEDVARIFGAALLAGKRQAALARLLLAADVP